MIFRRHKEEGTSAPETPETAAAQPEASQPAAEATPETGGEAGISVLTSDVIMEGNLVTSGELLLDGTIHGAVQAARVTIDTNGAVNGQVVATEVLVRGRVIGPICGARVHLVPGAQVEGDVLSQSIVVEDGAYIDGQIRHSEDPLGEWQQMWYGEEAEAGEEAATEASGVSEDTEATYAPTADYLRPAPAAEEESVIEGGAETTEDADAESLRDQVLTPESGVTEPDREER